MHGNGPCNVVENHMFVFNGVEWRNMKEPTALESRLAPIGIESFAELVDPINRGLFVDRSLWLKSLFQEKAKVMAFHTFRRSGKSLTASMIEHFFAADVVGQPTAGLLQKI